jgi:hypothetical protein
VGRKGLQRKSRRICISKSEELERKARFFAKQKMCASIQERVQLSFGTGSNDKQVFFTYFCFSVREVSAVRGYSSLIP